jgi:hypothetical protein
MDTLNQKIGRNQACPCGSGKKYKKCCLSLAPHPAKRAPIAASTIESQFERFFTPGRWAVSELQRFQDLEELIRSSVPLPPAESDGLWDPIRFTDFLNEARAVVENILVQAASRWSPLRWLYYLRHLPDFVWQGELATTGPYDRSLAELLTSTSTAEPTFHPGIGFDLDREIADHITSFCCGVRFLSTIHSNLRWCGKGARFDTGQSVIGKPVPSPEIQQGVALYDSRVAAVGGPFLSGTGSLAGAQDGANADLRINVMVETLFPDGGTDFAILPVFLNDLARLNARARLKNIQWWPEELGPLLMLLRFVSSLLDSDSETRIRAKMWGGVLMPEEEFLRPSDALFADGVSFVQQVFPGIVLPDTAAQLLSRLEDLKPSFWPMCFGSPLRREGKLIFIDVRAATVLMNQLSEFEAAGGTKGGLRGAHFEEKVQALIDLSPWAPGDALARQVGMDLYRGPRLITDLDALGAKDDVLLLVSCKSLAKTTQYDMGDFHKVRAAKTTVEKAVTALRNLEADIKQDPTAFNFDFTRYRKIIAVVCVPGIIYVPGGPATELIEPGLRAAVSADELSKWMNQEKA